MILKKISRQQKCAKLPSRYNAFNVYCHELAPDTVSLTGDRAQGDDSKHCANSKGLTIIIEMFVLLDLILYVPSTIFQLNRDGSSWVKPVLSKDKSVLLKDTTR